MTVSICVVVGDSGKAKILLAETGRDPLTELKEYEHPESRLKEQDLVSDGSGSGLDSGGYGKHSMGHEKSAHKEQAKTFAHELCAEIDKLRRNRDLRRIYLVASPKFLGLLRSSLSKQCAGMLAGEVNKDLVNQGIEEIRNHLPKRL